MRKRLIDLLTISLVGLTPLLWFRNSQIILGHDSGLVLSPVTHFLDRIQIWTLRFGMGHDQTYAIPGFFIHGLEALFYFLGFSIQGVQKITFVFWFILPGITMYLFAHWLSKKINIEHLALPASIFYMMNHFLLQGWFIAERTKFSLYAALPLVMLLLFQWRERERGSFRTAIFISLTIFFLNGGASFPLFGGLFVCIFVFVIYFFYKEGVNRESILSIILLAICTAVFSLLLNAYWFIPLLSFVSQSYVTTVEGIGGVGGVLTWVNTISQDASLTNLFRLQGVPEWYQNPEHPYALNFLNNPALIAASYTLPLLAFSSLLFVKKKKPVIIVFFVVLALISMLFVGGSHPPFGAFYILLVNFIPGFVAFRTPFYKFAPALWFAYSILIAFAFNELINRRINSYKVKFSIVLIFIVGILFYNFPFFSGNFFDYVKNERSTRVTPPQYLFDFRNWADSQKSETNILSLPPANRENKIEAYDWGYWSVSPLTSLITNTQIINRSGMSESELRITDHMYQQLKNNNSMWKNLAQVLGISHFLIKNDYQSNSQGSRTEEPEQFRNAFIQERLSNKFGKWDIYDFEHQNETKKRLNLVNGNPEDIGLISTLAFFNPNDEYLVSSNVDSNNELNKYLSDEYIVPTCIRCDLQNEVINRDLYRPLITQGSLLYPYINSKNKKTETTLQGTTAIDYYAYKTLEQILALDRVVIEERNTETLPAIVAEYSRLLSKLEESLKSELKSSNNSLLIRVNNVLRIEEDIVLSNTPKINDKSLLASLDLAFNQIYKIKNLISNNIWISNTEEGKRFLFSLENEGEYEVYYNPNEDLPYDQIQFSVDGASTSATISQVNGWTMLGATTLKKGFHRIEVAQPINEKYDGEESFFISSTSSGSCFLSNVVDGNQNDVYRISFDHRASRGNKKFYIKVLDAEVQPNTIDVTDFSLNSSPLWNNHQTDYKIGTVNSKGFYVAICNPPQVDEIAASQIEIDNFSIRKIAVPNLVLFKKNNGYVFSEVSTSKESNTKYQANNNSDSLGLLVLNQSFSDNWVAYSPDSIKFMANGFANGWIVPTESDVKIEYKTQKHVFIGFVISTITLFLVALFMLFSFLKNDKKN